MTETSTSRRWTVSSAARRSVEVLREQGIRGLLYGALAELGYRRVWIFELSLDSAPAPRALPEGVEIAELHDGRIDEDMARGVQIPSELSMERLRAGHRCFLARSAGRIVSVQWAAVERVPSDYLGGELPLARHEACSYESFTAPDARARGLGQALRVSMARQLQEAGYRRLLALILPENAPAFRLVQKLGYVRIGTVHSLRLGRMRAMRCRMTRGSRRPGRPA